MKTKLFFIVLFFLVINKNGFTQCTPEAGPDVYACGKFAYICVTSCGYPGQWTSPGGIAYYDAPIDSIIHNVPSYKDSVCAWIRYSSENDTVKMIWKEFDGTNYYSDSVNVYFGTIQPAIALVNPTDTFVCGATYYNLNAQQPQYGSGFWIDTVQNTVFSPSSDITYPIATIDISGNGSYGWHHFYWITVNGTCRDTSSVVPVLFIETPQANAGLNYWPGLFGANSEIKTDTVCGLSWQMGAIPSVGVGNWYSNVSTCVNLVPNQYPAIDSLYITCSGDYSVFNPGIKYREFIWQENNNGCYDSDTIRLYFAPNPTGQFTTTMPACRHDSSMIVAHTWPSPNSLDYGITKFTWQYPQGLMSNVIANPNISDTIYVSWATGEQHPVTLITTNTWGCSSWIVSHVITEPAPFMPSYNLIYATNGNCNGSIELSSSSYYTYNWPAFGNSTSLTQTNLCPIIYNVIVTGQSNSIDAAPNTYCHDIVSINVGSVGVSDNTFENEILIIPNPASDFINIISKNISDKIISVKIIDENGKEFFNLLNENNLNKLEKINISQIPSGVIYLRIITDKHVIVKKVVVIH